MSLILHSATKNIGIDEFYFVAYICTTTKYKSPNTKYYYTFILIDITCKTKQPQQQQNRWNWQKNVYKKNELVDANGNKKWLNKKSNDSKCCVC